MTLQKKLWDMLDARGGLIRNPPREGMIRAAVDRGEALVSGCGCLATWTPPESTGRSPRDTVIVKRSSSAGNIDWTSPNNIPVPESTFNMVFEDALDSLSVVSDIFITDRLIGADSE